MTPALLGVAYIDYCTNVSRRGMAADIISLSFLFDLCREREARVVTDFGSGFSSYVLAYYAVMAPYPVRVVSVDDSAEWLAKSAAFVTRYGMSTDGFVLWEDWLTAPVKFDVGFYDLASGDVREGGMRPVLEQGGVVLFDDAQHDGHRACMVAAADAVGGRVVDVSAETRDEIGRFGLLVER